jgi:hypothetical protein
VTGVVVVVVVVAEQLVWRVSQREPREWLARVDGE